VKVPVVRLEILDASEGPTIWEFQLFGPPRRTACPQQGARRRDRTGDEIR